MDSNIIRIRVCKMAVLVFVLMTGALLASEKHGFRDTFDDGPTGWGGDGSMYEMRGGNPESGGYHQGTRDGYNPYHQPIGGKAAEFLKGDLIERFGNLFKVSLDVKLISGGNKGFIIFIYGRDALDVPTYWYREILSPGKVPAEWTKISFEINALDETKWKRGAGSLSLIDTLRNVGEFQLFGGNGRASGPIVTGIDNFEIAPLKSVEVPEPKQFDSWKPDRKYRILVDVLKPEKPFVDNIPFSKTVYFGKLLKKAGVNETFAPGSVIVTCYDPKTGKEKIIPYLMDESFVAKDFGSISWNIADDSQRRFAIYFDTKGKPSINRGYVSLVGIGDNFRYNYKGKTSPISTHGIRPATGDIDGDGLVDKVSPSIYTSTWGQPKFTIWFWKNIGSNEKPVFADFVRLYDSAGNIIPNEYNNCDLFDWNNDGKLDLITRSTVYINTGKVNKAGMPIFEKVAKVNVPGKLTFIGLRDHDKDGVYDAFYYKYGCHYAYEGNPARNYLHTTLYIARNTAGAGNTPRFSKPQPITLDSKTTIENVMISDLYDFDGDGDLDCVGELVPLDQIPSIPKLVCWPNIASSGDAPVYGKMRIIPNSENLGYSGVIGADNAAFKGMLVAEGHRVKYYQRDKDAGISDVPGHKDRGLLKQIENRCVVDGYNGIDVEDWDGDGDWDLLAGSEFGHVWLIKNVGNNKWPVFKSPVMVKADGKPIRVMRWQYIKDGNPEYYLGQTKPRYADWDGDGDMDIILANHTNRILFFNNIGTRKAPAFAKGKVIKVDSDDAPFAFRNQPGVVDWNNDGKIDIVTRDKTGNLCLFLGIGGSGEKVKSPMILKYYDGVSILDPRSHHDKAHSVGQWDVCDWDGDGDYDIIGQFGPWGKAGPHLFENVGSNEKPSFKRPVGLACFGKTISISNHEHSFAVVDWYGQGKYDLVCGGESGLFFFFRRPALDNKFLPKASISNKLQVRQSE